MPAPTPMKTILAAAALAFIPALAGSPIVTSGVVPPVYTLPLPGESADAHIDRHFEMVKGRPVQFEATALHTSWESGGGTYDGTTPLEGMNAEEIKAAHAAAMGLAMDAYPPD